MPLCSAPSMRFASLRPRVSARPAGIDGGLRAAPESGSCVMTGTTLVVPFKKTVYDTTG